MKNLIIVGAGGFGREMIAWAKQSHGYGEDFVLKGFLDDNPQALKDFAVDLPVCGSVATYDIKEEDVFCCAIGNPKFKRRCIESITRRGGHFISLIHRSAVLGERNQIGNGLILCPYAVITSDVKIGDFVTVNLHSFIAHDTKIGSFSQLHCHVDICGHVEIGEETLLGSHASLLPQISLGDRVNVSAGAVVAASFESDITLAGIPARPIRKDTQ